MLATTPRKNICFGSVNCDALVPRKINNLQPSWQKCFRNMGDVPSSTLVSRRAGRGARKGGEDKVSTSRWDETWHRLREWTDGPTRAERLAAQVLIREGFKSIDPSHPLGDRTAAETRSAGRMVSRG